MTARGKRRLLVSAVLALLFLLHNDLWLWQDRRSWLGLPAGLLYHIGYCLAAAAGMALLVRRAWPEHLEVEPPPLERG